MTIFSDNPVDSDKSIPKVALYLGVAGLVPFIIGGLLAITLGAGVVLPEKADMFLVGYGAIILSFMAGVRWGLAFAEHNESEQALQFGMSVIPPLVAWIAFFLPFAFGLPLLALSHAALAVWDIRGMYSGRGPMWYGKLRMILSSIAVGLLVVVGLVRYFLMVSA